MRKLSKEEVDDLKLQGMSIGLSNADMTDLFDHIDAIESELEQANENTRMTLANSKAWQDTLLATQRELEQAKQQIPQKVVLPKDVAEAIETLRSELAYQNDDIHLLWCLIQAPKEEDEGEFDHLIQTLVNESKLDVFDLAKAIMFGYTVEQEPTVEDKLRTAWTPIVKSVLYDYNGSYNGEIARKVIDKIMPLTREILKAEELMQHEQS